jgi:uncharacterized membrane protein YidH (DUF202 family)
MKKKLLGGVLLVGGIVLLAVGLLGRESLESGLAQAKETLQNTSISTKTWIVAGGAVISAAGIGLMLMKQK